jgi:2-methylaconitate cis-trans-isomerase PrpF
MPTSETLTPLLDSVNESKPTHQILERNGLIAQKVRSGSSCCLVVVSLDDSPVSVDFLKAIYALGKHSEENHLLSGKIGVVYKSKTESSDIDLCFYQVDFNTGELIANSLCGHQIGAAAQVGRELGLIADAARIHCVHTNQNVTAHAQQRNLWRLDFSDAVAAELLPTGAPINNLVIDGKTVPATLLNAGNPYCIIKDSTHLPRTILDKLKLQAASLLHISPAANLPKVALVRRADDGLSHIFARVYALTGFFHPAMPITGAVAIATAASLDGTIVGRYMTHPVTDRAIRIQHPTGVKEVVVDATCGKIRQLLVDVEVETLQVI